MQLKILMLAPLLAVATPASAEPVRDISVVVLPFGGGGGDTTNRNAELNMRIQALLVTMHDLGLLRLHQSPYTPALFSACFVPTPVLGEAGNSPNTIQCVGDRLKNHQATDAPIALIVEDTRKRGSAQDFTCIGPGGRAVGRNPIYLADLFHIYPDVRKSLRNHLMECIEGALGAGG